MASQDSADAKTRAEALKAEGNALHIARKYKEAYAKYSEAIKADDDNAILYANRAASSLEMREYLDAACDASKAAQLDPKYMKAWVRLGKASLALHAYSESINAWEKAVALCGVPSVGVKLTRIEEQQLKTCREGLKAAKTAEELRHKKTDANIFTVDVNTGSLPWQRAEKMEPDIQKIGMSSAWVIVNAYRDFKKGSDDMKMTTYRNGRLSGPGGVIVDITNGILRDPRAFHMDCPDWIERYNRQMLMESRGCEAWPEAGPKEVQIQAAKMQKELGWDAVRCALAVTVRGWFMRAYLQGATTHDHRSSVEYLGSAISVLEWGLEAWKDVSDDDRGAIFRPTFVRGIRRFHLESYLAAYRDHGPDAGFTLDELDRLAQNMIDDVEANKPIGNEDFMCDAGFFGSFFVYPLAEACTARAFVYMNKAVKAKESEFAIDCFAEAAELYMKAASVFPPDEEKRLYLLKVAVEMKWQAGAPLKEVLSICRLVRSDAPRVARIWEDSPYSKELMTHLALLSMLEEKAVVGLMYGHLTLESPSNAVELFPSATRS